MRANVLMLSWPVWMCVCREPVLTRVRFVQAISLGLVLGFVYFRCVSRAQLPLNRRRSV